ncbi:hypothetical protein SBF1_880016 [Candidatus Desulfosporosinus infrequens]|uniref:Uncharacterized protein n=1 Tax=Candidatus Desulfosporosinus infrequens TaxID=2043169 RepID=A0A2U3LVU8_9FIRM|nr:hypothetical protein SBF1_880016 [Candidatus Desulfosporosinus infrequens]
MCISIKNALFFPGITVDNLVERMFSLDNPQSQQKKALGDPKSTNACHVK